MLLCIEHARRAIRQIFAELVTRHDDQTDIDAALAKGSVQMDHIHDQKIASGRDLNFNANADACTIHNFALDPVHIAGNLFCPPAKAVELLVDKFSNGSPAVGILFLFDQELKAR